MDDESVRSATRSELNTFQVLANTEFADLKKPAPTSWGGSPMPIVDERQRQESQKEDYDEAKVVSRDASVARSYRSVTPTRAPSVHSVKSVDSIKSVVTEVTEVVSPPKPHEYSARAKEEAAIDVAIEKESLLYELEMMEKQGSIKLHRQLTMSDSLEAIQYQYDRANMIVSTQQTVEWAKTGIKMGSGLLETVVKKFGLNVVDGFSSNLCKDMNKFNQPLTKMYRKYWRRGSSSPESELAMIVFGALAMTVMNNKGFMGGSKPEPFARPQVPQAPQQTEPSALRPPASVAPVQSKIPDWAKAALSADLQKPTHFASANRTEISQVRTEVSKEPEIAELAPPVPTTFLPRIESKQEQRPEQLQEQKQEQRQEQRVEQRPEQRPEEENKRKLTLLASPRTNRRRKDVSEDLVLN